MPHALDPPSVRELVVTGIVAAGTLWAVNTYVKWDNSYGGLQGQIGQVVHQINKYVQKAVHTFEVDTRGKDTISDQVNPPTGQFGGHEPGLINQSQSTSYSYSLVNRSAKYQPHTELQKDESKERMFKELYTARLHI